MNFWDSSAIVSLFLREQNTNAMEIFQKDPGMIIWWGTPVECHGAFQRRAREGRGHLTEEARSRFSELSTNWVQISPAEHLRSRAERLLAQHPLSAADALQLAAALGWADEEPFDKGFVCLDNRLREAAGKEGFKVLPAV